MKKVEQEKVTQAFQEARFLAQRIMEVAELHPRIAKEGDFADAAITAAELWEHLFELADFPGHHLTIKDEIKERDAGIISFLKEV